MVQRHSAGFIKWKLALLVIMGLFVLAGLENVQAPSRSSCESKDWKGPFMGDDYYYYISNVHCEAIVTKAILTCALQPCFNCGGDLNLPRAQWITISGGAGNIGESGTSCSKNFNFIGGPGEAWLEAGFHSFRCSGGSNFAVSWCADAQNDCTRIFCGTNNVAGMYNKGTDDYYGDTRFICIDREWHSCNWGDTGDWVTEHTTNQIAGGFICAAVGWVQCTCTPGTSQPCEGGTETCNNDCVSWGGCICTEGLHRNNGCQVCSSSEWTDVSTGTLCTDVTGKCHNGVCDKKNPSAVVLISNGYNYTNSRLVNLSLISSDYSMPLYSSGIKECNYSNSTWSSGWSIENCNAVKSIYIPSGDGLKTIFFAARDNAGMENFTNSTITLDTINPLLTISIVPNPPKSTQIVNLSASATDLNLKNISLYVDNQLVKNCTASPCNISVSYNRTMAHTYKAIAYDWARNFNRTEMNFTVAGNYGMTCAANNEGSGVMCSEDYFCLYPGVFANSSEGSGENARCCSTYCVSSSALLKCDGPPINGIQYDSSFFSCSLPYQDIKEADVENENLSCCSGTPSSAISAGQLYWGRQNSGYFKLTEAAEGDSLFCIVSGAQGTKVSFEITGPSKTDSGNQTIGADGLAKYPVLTDEVGTYSCKATVEGIALNSSNILVTEAGANPTTLSFFGITQLLAALSFILIYYLFKKQ
jgi:hypothetical protein